MVPHGKNPSISLLVRKRQQTEGHFDVTAASAPTYAMEAGAEQSTPWRSRSRSTGDRTLCLQEHMAPSKIVGTTSQAVGDSPPSAQRSSTNFIKVDPAAKVSLIQDLVKS